jgi:hypothetical protein
MAGAYVARSKSREVRDCGNCSKVADSTAQPYDYARAAWAVSATYDSQGNQVLTDAAGSLPTAHPLRRRAAAHENLVGSPSAHAAPMNSLRDWLVDPKESSFYCCVTRWSRAHFPSARIGRRRLIPARST